MKNIAKKIAILSMVGMMKCLKLALSVVTIRTPIKAVYLRVDGIFQYRY